MRRIILIGILAIIVIFMTNVCFALRWGRNLVSVGDTKFDVLSRCGEPVLKEIIGYGDQDNLQKVEVWIYDAKSLGIGSFDYQLVFRGLKLVKIKHLIP